MRENLGGDARPRLLRGARAPGRRRADPHLRRARAARGPRRARLLRQGRLRGAPGDEPARRAARRAASATTRSAARSPSARCRAARATSAPPAPDGLPRRSPDVTDDNPLFAPPFVGTRVAKGIAIDEIAQVPQPHGALPQPVGLPPRAGRGRPGVQGPRPRRAPRGARQGHRRRAARPPGRLGPPAGRGGRHRPRRLRPTTSARRSARASSSRASTRSRGCASRTSSARVESPDRDYASFMLVTMGPRVSERCQQLFAEDRYTDYLQAARPRRRDGRGAGRAVAPAHPRGARLRRRGRPHGPGALPPAVPRRALLVGVPRVPGPHRQREGRRRCSARTASA